MNNDPNIIDIDDIRRAGHCVSGTKKWFDAQGLNFRAFIKNGGISADVLLATGDGLAKQVIDRKRERIGQ